MFGIGVWMAMARKKKGYRAASSKRIAGIKRVFAYGVVMSLVLGLVCLRRAKADTAEAMRGLAKDLQPLADLLQGGSELRINGEKLYAVSSSSLASAREVLDRFAKNCEENPSVLTRELDEKTKGAMKLGLVRSGDDQEGAVMCIVGRDGAGSDIATAMKEFSRTQDLGAIGRLRYAYAKQTPSGAHVLTAWTEDRFSFAALAPEGDGDAPGNDSSIVPRPKAGRRLLTAQIAGTAYGVRVYDAPGTEEETLSFYDDALREKGFRRLGTPQGERGYLRDGLLVTLVVVKNQTGVNVSFAELGANGP